MYRILAVSLLSLVNILTTLLIMFVLHLMFTNTAIADPTFDQNLIILYSIVVGLILLEITKWIAFYQLVIKQNNSWRYFYLAFGLLIIMALAKWSYSAFWAFGVSYLIIPFLFSVKVES